MRKMSVNWLIGKVTITQQTFTCSKSTIDTLEKGVKYFKVNNKDTRMTSMVLFMFP